MGLHAQLRSPCLECAEVSEAEHPCKALNVATTGSRVLGRPWASVEDVVCVCVWGGDPSLSSPILLPTPRSWEAQAHPFKSAWESPRAALPSKGRDIKAAAAGSGCGRGGRALGEVASLGSLSSWLGADPPGGRSGPLRVPAGQGREDLRLQSRTELCDLREPLLVSGPRLLQLPASLTSNLRLGLACGRGLLRG